MAYISSYRSGPRTNQSSFGGISAVNPQAKTDFKGYVDQAYDASKSRLDPLFQQQNAAFDQSMINRGIPVGGEAYGNASRDLRQSQNDAYTQAANQAIGVGMGAQAQDFGQDATRSQLANALLQSKWGIDLNSDLGFAGIDERARQFDNSLMQGDYQFDTTMDLNRWNLGNQWDMAWDRAQNDDFRWAAGQDRQDYYDQQQASQYDNALLMSLLGMNAPASPYYQDPSSAYNAQLGSWSSQYGNNSQFLGNLLGF